MSRHKALVKNTAIMMFGKTFTQFLSFFLLPLYTNFLPTDAYGTVDLILTYVGLLAPVVTIQQEMAAFRFLIDARGDEKKQADIIMTALRSTFLRLLTFIIPCLFVPLFVKWNYLYLALLCGVFTALSQLGLQIARGLGKNMQFTIASVIIGAVNVLSNLILICVWHFGAESILISMVVSNVCGLLYLFFALRMFRYFRIGVPNKKVKKEMLKYSWPLVPNGVSWWLINASDRTIVSLFLGVAANGIYAVVNKFPSAVSSFLSVFVMSWTESASLHINDKDRDEFFSSVAKNTLQIFSSLSILLIAAIPLVFDIIIGQEYREAYNYIPIGIVAVFFNAMVSVYSAIYVAKKMTKKVMNTSIISAIINIVVDFVLIKFVGLYAAVISTAVAYFSMMVYRHYDIKKYVHIKYSMPDIIMVVVGLVVVLPIYYSGNFVIYICGVIFAVFYTILRNWRTLKKLLKRIWSNS